MSRVYVTSDTHFGHKKIIEFEKEARPFATIEEHDRALVERWNSVVTKRDLVWHLGDVFFGKEGHHVLAALNGQKKLVLGNHDHHPLEIYQAYFTRIMGAAEYHGCIMTHVPVHVNQMYRYARNIHGHMHSKCIPDDRYACVSVERTALTPIPIESVLRRIS